MSIKIACLSVNKLRLNEFVFNLLFMLVVLNFKFVKQKSYETSMFVKHKQG